MANLPISGLSPGAAVSATDLFPDVQVVGVGPVRVTAAQIKFFCSASPSLVTPTILNTVTIGAQSSAQGKIILANTGVGAVPVSIQSSNLTPAAWTLTLPVGPGTPAHALLTDGAGVSYWGEPPVTTLQGGIASQIPYQSAPNVTSFIPNGTAGQFLLSAGTGAPSWSAVALDNVASVSGTLPTTNGGTGLTTIGTNGQALISNGTNLLWGNPANATSLAGGTAGAVPYQSAPNVTTFATIAAANSVFVSNGSIPGWGKVNLADNTNAVTGTLGTANGGTGLSTVGANGTVPVSNGTVLAYGTPPLATTATNLAGGVASQIPYQSAANTTAFVPNGTPGQVLTSNGTLAPSFQTLPNPAYVIATSTGGTISAKITGAGLTDRTGNYYTIYNTGGSQISLTTTTFDNTGAFPLAATTTTVILQPQSSMSITTVAVGTEYLIDLISPITGFFTATISSNTNIAGNNLSQYNVLQLSPTAAGFTVTLPAPSNTAAGKQFVVCNNTAFPVTISPLNGVAFLLQPATSATMVWNGGSWYATGLPGSAYTRAYGIQLGSSTTWATALGSITDYDGNIYSITNTSGTAGITVTFGAAAQVFVNQSAMSAATHTSNNTLYIRPYETITIQTYQASIGTYIFISSTEPQDFTCKATMGSMGAPPQNTDTTLNFVTNGTGGGHDPMGAFNNSTHTWTCPRSGQWLITLVLTLTNSNSANVLYNSQIRLNGNNANGILYFGVAWGTAQFAGGQSSSSAQCLISANAGDTVVATIYPYAAGAYLTPSNNSANTQLTFSLVG